MKPESERIARCRKKRKTQAVAYKGGVCCLCGYSRCLRSLHFHHLDPSKKSFALSDKGHTRSWENAKKELDKTVLVCANCHGEIEESLSVGV